MTETKWHPILCYNCTTNMGSVKSETAPRAVCIECIKKAATMQAVFMQEYE